MHQLWPLQASTWDTAVLTRRTDSYVGCTRRDLGPRTFSEDKPSEKALKRPVGFGKSLVSRETEGHTPFSKNIPEIPL
jgi:hypothetical protein